MLDTQKPPSDKPLEDLRSNIDVKHPMEEPPRIHFQRNTDLTPEAWQQQVDQQLKLEQAEHLGDSSNTSLHISEQPKSVFKDSKSTST